MPVPVLSDQERAQAYWQAIERVRALLDGRAQVEAVDVERAIAGLP